MASGKLQMFTLFPKLPAELREKIWKQAAITARDCSVVEAHWVAHRSFIFHPAAPAIFSVSYEAKYYANKIFGQQGISYITRRDPKALARVPRAVFNYDHDVIYFPYPSLCPTRHGDFIADFLRHVPKVDLGRLRYIAFSMPVLEGQFSLGSQPLQRKVYDGLNDRFLCIQAIARLSCDLSLKTLSLVFEEAASLSGRRIPLRVLPEPVSATINEVLLLGSMFRSFLKRNLVSGLRETGRSNWGDPDIKFYTVTRGAVDPSVVN